MKTRWLVLRKAILPLLLALMLGAPALSGCSLLKVTDTQLVSEPAYVYQTSLALPDLADVIEKARSSVVAVNTETNGYDSLRGAYTTQGAGSGWIIGSDGLIVTNNHIVDGVSVVTVMLDDGRIFQAQEIYADGLSDLAVIKVDASNLPVAKLGISNYANVSSGFVFNTTLTESTASTTQTYSASSTSSLSSDSRPMRMGEWVVALGNSLGMGISATYGIVSATGVSVSYDGNVIYNLIQTDASINNSNSGGPLVNLAGEVVGINNAKVAAAGVEGMRYAISIDEAYPILRQLIENGYVSRHDIGATLVTVNAAFASYNGLAVNYGAFITQVKQNSSASNAGLSSGDVIIAIGDTTVFSAEKFVNVLQSYEAGQEVKVTYYCGKHKKTTTVVLAGAA
ncbi:MAG: trypsin-like peptidase domain-containing protein [Dehalococcoidia bacterium]|nr:trypsin-like peptidase domain-containing protein [Dehalococcoidia bacterium]